MCYESQVLNNTYFQRRNLYQLCCGAVFVPARYTALLNKARIQVLYIADLYNILIRT